jgi:hypothetical protein
MSSEEIEYRGYILTVIFLSPQWQVGICPSQSGLPRLPAGEPPACGPTYEQALVRARLRVDELLNNARKS